MVSKEGLWLFGFLFGLLLLLLLLLLLFSGFCFVLFVFFIEASN